MTTKPIFNCGCGLGWEEVAYYDKPPPVESRFPLPNGSIYRRAYHRCCGCGHFLSVHDIDLSSLYTGSYVDTVYGSVDRLHATFQRIAALPPGRSDNRERLARIAKMAARQFPGALPRVLDIGAGTGVFPASVRDLGWPCVALDPDSRAVEHLRDWLKIPAFNGDFMSMDLAPLRAEFDIVTLNKVAEHVLDPVAMLDRAGTLLKPGGVLYVEVPDVAAFAEGPDREEFTIDHHHVFSPTSLTIAGRLAGLEVDVERLREPSGKYTLAAFMTASKIGDVLSDGASLIR